MDVVEVSILDITSLVSNHAGTIFSKRKIYTLTLGVIVCVEIMKSDHKNECWLYVCMYVVSLGLIFELLKYQFPLSTQKNP